MADQKNNKKVTIEKLAVMVGRGFDDTNNRMKKGFEDTDKGFEDVRNRLDRIEHFLIKKHDLEINDLKRRVREIEDLFAMPSRKR